MNYRTNKQSIQLHTLITKLKISAEDKKMLVYSYSEGRTETTKELTVTEANLLTRWLLKQLNSSSSTTEEMKQHYKGDPKDKQRKRIIGIFKGAGKTVAEAKAWAERQGVNGLKKEFNEYDAQELYHLNRVAEGFYGDSNRRG